MLGFGYSCKHYVGLQIKYREDGERFMSTFHYDMSKEIEHARKASQMTSQVGTQIQFYK